MTTFAKRAKLAGSFADCVHRELARQEDEQAANSERILKLVKAAQQPVVQRKSHRGKIVKVAKTEQTEMNFRRY